MTDAPIEARAERGVLGGIFSGFASQIGVLLAGFLCLPPTVRALGSDRFGVLGLVWVILGYLQLFDLGLSRSTTKFAADAMAREDGVRLRQTVGSSLCAQLLLGSAAGFLLAVFARPLAGTVFKVAPHLTREAGTAFLILAASIPAGLLAGSMGGLLEANRRFHLLNAVRTPFLILNFVIPYVASSFFGATMVGIAAALSVSKVVLAALLAAACLGSIPALRARPIFAAATLVELIRFGLWSTVTGLAGPLLIYLDQLMLGSLVGARAVGYYLGPHEVVTRLRVVPATLTTVLFPVFTSFLTLERNDFVGRLAARASKYLVLAMGVAAASMIMLGGDLVSFWLGPEIARNAGLAIKVLALGMFVNAFAHIPYWLLQSAGRPDLPAKFHLLELPLHIAYTWLLVRRFGITGAAVAWSIRGGIDAVLVTWSIFKLALVRWEMVNQFRVVTAVSSQCLLLVLCWSGSSSLEAMGSRLALLGLGVVISLVIALWLNDLAPLLNKTVA